MLVQRPPGGKFLVVLGGPGLQRAEGRRRENLGLIVIQHLSYLFPDFREISDAVLKAGSAFLINKPSEDSNGLIKILHGFGQ